MPTATTRPSPTQIPTRPGARPYSSRAVKRATYIVGSQQRVLFTLTVDGVAKLIDAPAELYESAVSGFATQDTFIVEPSLAQDSPDELVAIITDYVAQTMIRGRPAMACSRLGAFLDMLAA